MEARVIKDYDPKNHNITEDLLYNTNDWDLVELNYNVDSTNLKKWWDDLIAQYPETIFNFNKNHDLLNLEKSKEMVDTGYCGYYCGPIDGITIAWPVERYEPLPPPVQCNSELYPEVNIDSFMDDAVIMPKFYFGYFKDLVETLGHDAFRQVVTSRHYPGMYIKQHIDSKRLKLHIPIETPEGSYFHFGKDRDRKYHMKLGKIYILNTGDWHGTSNDTDQYRTHIITRVTRNHVLKVIGMSNDD